MLHTSHCIIVPAHYIHIQLWHTIYTFSYAVSRPNTQEPVVAKEPPYVMDWVVHKIGGIQKKKYGDKAPPVCAGCDNEHCNADAIGQGKKEVSEAAAGMAGRCKLDPGLKAPPGFKV